MGLPIGWLAFACGAAAVAIVARVWWTTRPAPAERRRRRALKGIEPDAGRPWRAWRAIARVGEAELQLLESMRANAGELPLRDLLADLEIDWTPPRAGPEVELRWSVLASSKGHAERFARRRLERLLLEPYTLRVEPIRVRPGDVRIPA